MLALAIDPRAVASFFDERAADWDERRAPDAERLRVILALADVRTGHRVLDVACGTGVLFGHYLEAGVASVTGVDISEKMLQVAAGTYGDGRITLVRANAEEAELEGHFDRVMVLDALPHFPSPRRLVANLARHIRPGGRLTIAHDIGRQRLNAVHHRGAREVSRGLMDERKLAAILSRHFAVDVVRSDAEVYVVSGVRGE